MTWFRFWYETFRKTFQDDGYNPLLTPICVMILPSCDTNWERYFMGVPCNDNKPEV